MVSKEDYGSRVARTTMESCRKCGASVVLTELTFQYVEDDTFEVHLSEECEHETTRPFVVYCAPKDATEFF